MKESKNFKLVFREPGKESRILASGDRNYCESKRLEYSMEGYNSEFLSVDESISILPEEDSKLKVDWELLIYMFAIRSLDFLFGKDGEK